VTPDDVGLNWAIGKAKGDFVGKRSLSRSGLRASESKQLVGLRPVDHGIVPDEGAQIIGDGRTEKSGSQGHVTSAYWSDAVEGPIAMALLRNGRARHGETVHVTSIKGGTTPWQVVDPVFYDPEGGRIHA